MDDSIEVIILNIDDIWDCIKIFFVLFIWYEVWGFIVMEVQFCGIFVIVFNFGGFFEVKVNVFFIIFINFVIGYQ